MLYSRFFFIKLYISFWAHFCFLYMSLIRFFWFLFLTCSNFLMLKPSSQGKHIDCREARKPVLSPELGFLQNTPRPTVWVRPKALPASPGVGNAGSVPPTRHLRWDGLSHHTLVFPSLQLGVAMAAGGGRKIQLQFRTLDEPITSPARPPLQLHLPQNGTESIKKKNTLSVGMRNVYMCPYNSYIIGVYV